MIRKKIFAAFVITIVFAVTSASAQNPPPRRRPSPPPPTPSPSATPAPEDNVPPTAPETTAPAPRTHGAGAARTPRGASDPAARGVLAAFNALLDGIRRADVNAVMSVYWNSPQLILFNNNGTVTRTWAQVRSNRMSSYPNLSNVTLEVRDERVQMLGRDAALLTCLWTQSQTYRGTPETATGRLTLVFRRAGTSWKVIHAHTSPDAPDPSRVPPSERAEPTPTRTTP
jgi:ketosteroid isomerase-like protein